ncbi:Viral IAP-associated factor [Blattella germanica]|nr:Viral IAP-associated factor [Blattella germanica]
MRAHLLWKECRNPNEDTEWNDILRSKGILPQKEKEVTEDDIVNMLEQTIEEKQSKSGKQLEQLSLDELDELEDEEDEKVILEYRAKRMAEIRAEAAKSKFGDIREISAEDYVQHVNNAGEGVWLSVKFPATKFLKSVSTTCIPNFPDSNLPSIFIYFEGDLKKQLIGPHEFRGMNLTVDELEWILGQFGAVPTKLEEDPRPKVRDVLFSKLKSKEDDLSDDNDW